MIRQLLYSELIKFKLELLILVQGLKTIKLFTINIQTYLSINLLVFIGIGINIFVLSTLPEIVYTQEIYDIIYYVGTVIYILLVAFTGSVIYFGLLAYLSLLSIYMYCICCIIKPLRYMIKKVIVFFIMHYDT